MYDENSLKSANIFSRFSAENWQNMNFEGVLKKDHGEILDSSRVISDSDYLSI